MARSTPRSARVKKRLPLQYGPQYPLTSTGFSVNFSAQGMGLQGGRPFSPGARLFFELKVPGGLRPCRTEGSVVWSREIVTGVGLRHELGVRILGADPEFYALSGAAVPGRVSRSKPRVPTAGTVASETSGGPPRSRPRVVIPDPPRRGSRSRPRVVLPEAQKSGSGSRPRVGLPEAQKSGSGSRPRVGLPEAQKTSSRSPPRVSVAELASRPARSRPRVPLAGLTAQAAAVPTLPPAAHKARLPRYGVDATLSVSAGAQVSAAARLKSVSASGLGFECDQLFPAGSRLYFAVRLDGRELKGSGKVVWVRESGHATEHGLRLTWVDEAWYRFVLSLGR